MSIYDDENLFRTPVKLRTQGEGRFTGQPRSNESEYNEFLRNLTAGQQIVLATAKEKLQHDNPNDRPKNSAGRGSVIGLFISAGLWVFILGSIYIIWKVQHAH